MKRKDYISIFDTDLDESKVLEFISEHPEIEILRHLGEIRVPNDNYSVGTEDTSFSAHNEAGKLSKYGGKSKVINDLSLIWTPTEADATHSESESFDLKKINKFKQDVLANKKSYNITKLVKNEVLEKIESDLLEREAD